MRIRIGFRAEKTTFEAVGCSRIATYRSAKSLYTQHIAAQTVGREIWIQKIDHVEKQRPWVTSGGGFLPERNLFWVVKCYRIGG